MEVPINNSDVFVVESIELVRFLHTATHACHSKAFKKLIVKVSDFFCDDGIHLYTYMILFPCMSFYAV
jgi:hypothetical protein